MKRREAFKALVSGGLALVTAKALAQEDDAESPAPMVADAGSVVVRGLPPGVVEIESAMRLADGTIAARGDAMELVVGGGGTALLLYRSVSLLRGLWQIYKPGDRGARTSIEDKTAARAFDLLDATVFPAFPRRSHTIWAYRNPQDIPGTQVRGVNGSPMYLEVSTASSSPALKIQLVEFNVDPATPTDLLNVSALPDVRRVLQEWVFPAGSGTRTKALKPFRIPATARFLALEVAQELDQTTEIRLRSRVGPLEIGEEPPRPDAYGMCAAGYVFDNATKACRWDPTAPEFVNYWYCLVEPAHGELRGPNWMSVPSNRDPVAWWHFLRGEAGKWFVVFNTRLMIGPPPTSTNAPSCSTAPPAGVDPWYGQPPPLR